MIAVLGTVVFFFWHLETQLPAMRYNDFLTSVEKNEIAEVHLKGGSITLTDMNGRKFSTFCPEVSNLIPILIAKNVAITGEPDRPSAIWNFTIVSVPLFLIIFAGWFFILRQQGKSQEKGEKEFAKDKVIRFTSGGQKVTFDDVAGIPEAKEELEEIVEILKNPKKFSRLGAIIPKGILLQGPPGTGKTLLARAIAGEAGVPFFSFSGSDFVEMFVGVGASRVRDLFSAAKENSPCIIFIDEIDAVGAHRSAAGSIGGQDERGQTLNALLVEMDGFGQDHTIIILAATNRPDILDPALLRAGRFDRQITILPPDVKGRHKILEVYAKKVKMSPNVDIIEVAKNTPGFTGAELANLVNEAAFMAAREGKDAIDLADFDAARDRIQMGAERKGMVITDKDRKTMACHEAGHAILAKFLPGADPVHKITIIPRGRAMGHTQQLPLQDRHAYAKDYLHDRITILMGGRAAEKILLGQQTTGAEEDLRQATEIATRMVTKWGMNDIVGPLAYATSDEGFLGDNITRRNFSETTARHIDQEVRKLIEDCYNEAVKLLEKEKAFLYHLTEILLQTETLDREEMEIIYECSVKKELEHEPDKPHECSICPSSEYCTQKPEAA
jgi:cell division protease FtsH